MEHSRTVGLPQSGVDGKSRMGFAADRLINAQYQISGTVIGKLDPVKHHDAIHRVELRQRIERRHGRQHGRVETVRLVKHSRHTGIRHNVPRELMHALVSVRIGV